MLAVVETHSAIANLLSQDAIFFHQVCDDMLLMLLVSNRRGTRRENKMDPIERAWRRRKLSLRLPTKSRRIEMESEDPVRFTGLFPRSSFANCLFAATAEARAANSSADIARVHRRRVHTGLGAWPAFGLPD